MKAGDRYGSYEVVRQIGHGAMGDVYLARDGRSGRELALKLVYKGTEADDVEILEAERVGAELQKRLQGVDDRVVSVHEYGEAAGYLYIDMEFVDGEDLSTLIARQPLHPGFAVYVARELCDMLENLRSFTTEIGERKLYGVVHGDLKPRNIRIDKRNRVKVIDFGIAKALTQTQRYTVNLFASTAYCSPERLETQKIDTQSDLWSVGVLLYQMIGQRMPFDEPTKERLERRICGRQGPDDLPNCPPPLRQIVFKMLARDAAKRYKTPAEASEDLARFQKGQAVLAETMVVSEPDTAREDAEATVRTSAAGHLEKSPQDRTVRSTPVLRRVAPARHSWGLIGCVAVVGIGAILTMAYLAMEVRFWNDAQSFAAALNSEKITDLDSAWSQYQTLNKRSHWGVLIWGAQSALRKRLVRAADATISEYRDSDAPSVFEPQWMQARTELSRALELDPGDNDIEGRLELAQAHIDRIDSAGLKAAARQKKLNSALTKFEEAAALMKRSPDPDLGLASLYAYDLNDVEKATDALNRAARNGHRIGGRETAQLGDAYRRRGDRSWKQSRTFVAMPDEERNYLDQAKNDYVQAERLYTRAGLFGDAARNKVQTIRSEQRVEQRLSELTDRPVYQ